jgi:hypothetical protein
MSAATGLSMLATPPGSRNTIAAAGVVAWGRTDIETYKEPVWLTYYCDDRFSESDVGA